MRTNSAGRHPLLVAVLVVLSVAVVPGEIAGESPPDDPIEQAERAVERAEFDRLIPLLESTVEHDEGADEPMAHLLYALGLVYRAGQQDDDAERRRFYDRADEQIETALQLDADLQLDPLVYPPRFIARVQNARGRLDDAPDTAGSRRAELFYFERRVEHHSAIPVYLPGGAGQFYGGRPFRGATFAAVQLAGLATNAVAFWAVESMRAPSGGIPPGEIDSARNWRRAQYAGLALFAAGWLAGTVEAHLNFEPETIRIRTLDQPPDELAPLSEDPNEQVSLPLGVGIVWATRF